ELLWLLALLLVSLLLFVAEESSWKRCKWLLRQAVKSLAKRPALLEVVLGVASMVEHDPVPMVINLTMEDEVKEEEEDSHNFLENDETRWDGMLAEQLMVFGEEPAVLMELAPVA
ncbi:unnamed protein product, partial [Symbiodinium natans]